MYCIIRDSNGDYYVIPTDKREEARQYFDTIDEFWDDQDQWPEYPSFIDAVNGSVSLVCFTDYTIL